MDIILNITIEKNYLNNIINEKYRVIQWALTLKQFKQNYDHYFLWQLGSSILKMIFFKFNKFYNG